MSYKKFLNRAIKSGMIRNRYGKAAQQRYNRACLEYDGLACLGIKGVSAWCVREQMKDHRKRAAKRSVIASNQRSPKKSTIPSTPVQTFRKHLLWAGIAGFVFPLTLVLSIPFLYFEWKDLTP